MAVLEVSEHLIDRMVEPHGEDLTPAVGEQHLVRVGVRKASGSVVRGVRGVGVGEG